MDFEMCGYFTIIAICLICLIVTRNATGFTSFVVKVSGGKATNVIGQNQKLIKISRR